MKKQTAEWLDKMKSIQGKRAELHPIDDACEYQTGGFVSFEDFLGGIRCIYPMKHYSL